MSIDNLNSQGVEYTILDNNKQDKANKFARHFDALDSLCLIINKIKNGRI